MTQSDSRVPGRSGEPRVRAGSSSPPSSFGRQVEPEPIVVPVLPQAGPVGVVDGKVVLEVAAQLVIDQGSAQAFYDEVRQLTMLAIRDGYAAAMGVEAAGFGVAGDQDVAGEGAAQRTGP